MATGAAKKEAEGSILGLALPPLLLSLVYLPCVTYSEWYIDELFAVLRNPDARGESPLSEVFTNDFWGNPLYGGKGTWTHKSYRPIGVLSFAWQFFLLGSDLFRPQPLRAFNIATHSANTLILLAVLRSGLRLSRRWSRLAACLFAVHPVHVENIVYLVGRADELATTGFLVAALAVLHVQNLRPPGLPPRLVARCLLLALCVLLAVLAGLCKESGLTLLVFVAGIELCSPRKPQWHSVLLAIGALLSFVAVSYIRIRITQGTAATFGFVDTPVQYAEDRGVRTFTYLFQHSYYGKLLVLPGSLSWDYSFDAIPLLRASWRDVRTLGVLSAYLWLIALASWSLAGKGRRRLLLGLQHVIVPFVPASNLFFTVGTTVGERLLYPSTVGAAIAAAAWGEGLERQTTAKEPAGRGQARLRLGWPSAVGYLLLATYTWKCANRVWEWRSSEALYAADAASWPMSVKTRHQLGTVYHAMNRYEDALFHYKASLEILDDNALTDHCIAQIYIETGRFPLAVEQFEKIFRGHGVGFSPFNLWMLYVDYGFALVALGRFEDAVPSLETGLAKNEAVPHGLNALGYAFASLSKLQEAQEAFAKGLEYDPENGIIWNNLAVVWMAAGAWEQAAQGLEKALSLEPGHGSLLHNGMLLQRAAQAGGVLDVRPKLELFFSRTT